jgi:hypothetical protein
MSLETRLRACIAMLLLSLTILTFFFFQQQDELKKCKEGVGFIQGGDIEKQDLVNQRDSLQSELFATGVQLGRYEVAFELFKEKNKTGADEFELILTTQTE